MPRNDDSIFVKDVLETITCQVKPAMTFRVIYAVRPPQACSPVPRR
jgi:hypothetical protein